MQFDNFSINFVILCVV